MASPLKIQVPKFFSSASPNAEGFARQTAGTRSQIVAIVDIGSNSVRLVAYEDVGRAPTPVFNEKVLCGLGRGVASTGLLNPEATEKALAALRNFRALCRNMRVTNVQVIATAATRDAQNGAAFLAAATEAIGAEVNLIDGKHEARLSALGVMSSFYRPDGVTGDLGGGSLELAEVSHQDVGTGMSLQIGGLALMDLSRGSPKRAVRIVRDALADAPPLKRLKGRTFYAVGGTWRALARLHMRQRNYALDVMHGYVIPAAEAGAFRAAGRAHQHRGAFVDRRRERGAAAFAVLWRSGARRDHPRGPPRQIVISASGVREGLMFERLPPAQRDLDPLLAAADEFNRLRARDPQHGTELCDWTDAFLASTHLDETGEERRLRRAACLLADSMWRVHPDYRSAQALSMIANANLSGIDHPGRAFLALAVASRQSVPMRMSARRCAASSRRACSTGRAFSPRACGSPTSCRPRWVACCPGPA